MVLFGQQFFYSGKSYCIRENVVVFGQTGCFLGKSGFIRQSVFIRTKVVVFGQMWQ